MAHTIIWKYVVAGEVKALVGHPAAFSASPEEAVQEGMAIVASLPDSVEMSPVAVVETDDDIAEDIYACEEEYVDPEGEDLLFFDISGMGKWSGQDWWPA